MAPETFVIDLDSLSIREIKILEAQTGKSLTSIASLLTDGSDEPIGELLQTIAYIVKRREDPSFTFEQAEDLVISLDGPDPTKAAG